MTTTDTYIEEALTRNDAGTIFQKNISPIDVIKGEILITKLPAGDGVRRFNIGDICNDIISCNKPVQITIIDIYEDNRYTKYVVNDGIKSYVLRDKDITI